MASMPEDLLLQLSRLPSIGSGSISGLTSVGSHAVGVNAWRQELRRGRLPLGIDWPKEDVFTSTLLDAMAELDMARFCGRNTQLVDTLVRNIVSLYEKYLEAVNEQVLNDMVLIAY